MGWDRPFCCALNTHGFYCCLGSVQTHPRSAGASPSLPTKRPRVDEAEEDEIEEVLVSYQKPGSQTISESDEDVSEAEEEEGRQTWAANGSETRKETMEENEGYLSPPVPPRVQSVRRSNSPFADASSLSLPTSNTADHFLGAGRGGEVINISPPALPSTDSKVIADLKPFESLSERNFEEQALINELQELEKLVLSVPEQEVVKESMTEERIQSVELPPDEHTQKVPGSTEDAGLRQRDVLNAKIR